ncbi:sodium- and chloride-dependent neutral and basic amino acid transporter B(0+)-like isoform X2 [Rhinatrema bivittatum]|uniref:sodium- and chloride-dependent neutral and basic amino acid transporter B(0+)-like isoform X2 n=1 Tax=Rhinatrema bivittatum TaxID=194408 RepID=UPI00112AF37C|nr:sodium- and chloride-dependent neutral and basic amino acid transporter B(0+)-like isoform X2 [Rhinatrema bivittatum]
MAGVGVGSLSQVSAQDARGNGDENIERGNWASKADYILSLIGFAVGLGNVWRFPYLTYKNGGGAFLIPYTIMLACAGLPLFFLECSLGQFSSLGPVAAWKIVPTFKVSCKVNLEGKIIKMNMTLVKEKNLTCLANTTISESVDFPSKQYWDKVTLRRSSGFDDTGDVVWHLALSLLLAWIIVGAALFRGIKTSGKVVYFTALFPYIVLTILLIRGITLEGAGDGINYYIGTQSDISKLKEAEVWKDAATQIFFSLSTAWGGLIALSSYSKFYSNCYLDAITVSVTNCLTSVFAGFAIFSILGHMAHVLEIPISEVAESETMITAIQDAFPKETKTMRMPLTAACCTVLFLLGLVCVTQAGIYWVNLMDYFCGGWVLLFVAVLELIAICWIYGGNRFIEDIEMMIGKQKWHFWLWWRACWFYISPILLSIILFWSLATFTAPTFGPIQYPTWGVVLGWLLIVVCLIWLPIFASKEIYKAEGNLWQRIVKACGPAADWGPALERHRGERYSHIITSKSEKAEIEIPTVSG